MYNDSLTWNSFISLTFLNLKKNETYAVLFAHWTICPHVTHYIANFTLFICQSFNSLSTIISWVLFHLGEFLFFSYDFCTFVNVPNEVFIYGTSNKILVVIELIWPSGFDRLLGLNFTSLLGPQVSNVL